MAIFALVEQNLNGLMVIFWINLLDSNKNRYEEVFKGNQMLNSSDSPTFSTQDVEELFKQLQIDEFIKNNKSFIYPKLESYDLLVEQTKEQWKYKGPGVLMFIAASLPLIKGIIYVGSNSKNFNEAINWIKEELCWVDPESILVGLTFLRIVEKWKDFYSSEKDEVVNYPCGEKTKQEIWKRIHQRVTLLVE